MAMKNPLTPAGIEPATFRFVAQHLNHCATAVPIVLYMVGNINVYFNNNGFFLTVFMALRNWHIAISVLLIGALFIY